MSLKQIHCTYRIHVSLSLVTGALVTSHILKDSLFVVVGGKDSTEEGSGPVEKQGAARWVTRLGTVLRFGRNPFLLRLVEPRGH